MVDRNRAVGMGNSANGHGVAVPPLEVAGKPRHRGTRGVEFLLVGKLPGEPEGLAWLLEALRLRAWEEGTVREDTDSLAQVAGISTRSARRHLKLAIERGYLHEQGRVLRIDQEAFRRRDQALREAGCVRVKVFADILRDPDLKPVDRRIIAWVRAKGRGVNRGGGAFVLSREAMARELGIRASTLHDRLHALGDRLEHRWRRCADGRLRRTIWAQAPGQNRRPEWPESETTSPRLPWPESETTENQSGKGP